MAAVAPLVVVFAALAMFLRGAPGTWWDVAATLAVQGVEHPLFDAVLYAASVPGFAPTAWVVPVVGVLALWLAGLRREGVFLAIAACVGLLSALMKIVVARPRPTDDLVRVLDLRHDFSFPSGHVTSYTAMYGFLLFLAYTRLRPSWLRSVVIAVLGALIALVGPSRMYLGHHWLSDVVGGYALGGAYLLLVVAAYQAQMRRAAERASDDVR